MSVDVLERSNVDVLPVRTWFLSRERVWELLTLGSVVLTAGALRFVNIAALGYANHYYSAAVEAMMQSWHNFFFAAAEPGGSVTVDKPPVGLWFQVLSARIVGLNTLGVLLPEIIAGLLSVILVYYLVRRWFGHAAGVIAGLVLAVTPVVVATDRNNTIDSILIFTLLLAAWAFIRATETAKLRYLLLGTAIVGIAFNIKMLQAYLPLPAFFALYFFGAKKKLLPKLGNLTVATLLLLAISFSWATVVDMTPATQRPYVGSSSSNSEMSLIFGYNGLDRLIGMRFGRGAPSLSSFISGLLQTPSNVRGGFGGGFGGGTGRPGLLRLIVPPLSKETSWLLPLGLFAALLLAFRTRLRWPVAAQHQALVLWGGWLITGAVFFSIAGFFHEYYLSMLAPPLAALVGIGMIELWHLRDKRPRIALVLLIAGAGLTLGEQYVTASAFALPWWLPVAVLFVAVGALMLVPVFQQIKPVAVAGYMFVVAGLLLTPAIWSGLTTLNSSANQSLPSAYGGRPSGPLNRGASIVDQQLLNYLIPRTQNTKYLMAVPSSMQGADYVIATGRPVLYMGGFMGQDHVVTSDDLAKLVASGQVHYIYWDARGGRGFGGQSEISNWVTSQCTPVQGYDTDAQNSGTPDGTGRNPQVNPSRGLGTMQISLYDCHPNG